MKICYITLFFFGILISCDSEKGPSEKRPHYKIKISQASLEKGTSSTVVNDISADWNDTAAFKEAVRNYWGLKIYIEKSNENFYKKYGRNSLEQPYYFVLYKYIGNDSSIVEFDSVTATRLALPIIEETKKSVIEYIKKQDSIINHPEPKPNIY